jgi:hypothetical protein
MIRNAMLAAMIALPAMAFAQDASVTTGSINQVDRAHVLSEEQVRDRLARAGYTAIGTLDRDSYGSWRTTAMKGPDMRAVTVDRSGEIEDQ